MVRSVIAVAVSGILAAQLCVVDVAEARIADDVAGLLSWGAEALRSTHPNRAPILAEKELSEKAPLPSGRCGEWIDHMEYGGTVYHEIRTDDKASCKQACIEDKKWCEGAMYDTVVSVCRLLLVLDDRKTEYNGYAESFRMCTDEEENSKCHEESIDSVPGKDWNAHYGWRYDTSDDEDPKERANKNYYNRVRAYQNLVSKKSAWPDWFKPSMSMIPPGTLFHMAMSSTQDDSRPGGFGTFDDIQSVEDVREELAVLKKWKRDVHRVNTYRVKRALPAYIGPVGPQVDPEACALLPGRFSQFEMLVPGPWRMQHVEYVSTRILPQPEDE